MLKTMIEDQSLATKLRRLIWPSAVRVFVNLAAACLILAFAAACLMNSQVHCLGPPYLLVTFHGGGGRDEINQVFQYSRDGCLLNAHILTPSPSASLRELRSMKLLNDGSLIVNSAFKERSQVLVYGACTKTDPTRSLIRVLAEGEFGGDTLLAHPNGLAITADQKDVYISNQDTCSIVSYSTQLNKVYNNEHIVAQYQPCDYKGTLCKHIFVDPTRGLTFFCFQAKNL